MDSIVDETFGDETASETHFYMYIDQQQVCVLFDTEIQSTLLKHFANDINFENIILDKEIDKAILLSVDPDPKAQTNNKQNEEYRLIKDIEDLVGIPN